MKVLLIKGNLPLNKQLLDVLKSQYCVVDIAVNETTGIEMQHQRDYDVILLDTTPSEGDTAGLCQRLRKQNCRAPLLVLTAHTDADFPLQVLEAGADDCIAPPFVSKTFLARLRTWQRRKTWEFADSALYWGELKLDPNQLRVTYQHREICLSPKEYNLLELFLRHPNRTFSRDDILDRLWTFDKAPSTSTVTNLVKDLRRKLRTAGVSGQPIKTLFGFGYRLTPSPEKAVMPSPKGPGLSAEPSNGFDLTPVMNTFQKKMGENLALIFAIPEAIDQESLIPEIYQRAKVAAHQLAVDLSALGYGNGAYIMRAIEYQLTESVEDGSSQTGQFNNLINRLKHVLTQPPSFETFETSTHCDASQTVLIGDRR